MNTISLWQDSLLHLTVKSTLLLAVAGLVNVAMYRLSAARRYWLWLSTILALLVLAGALPLLPAWKVVPVQAQASFLPMEEVTILPVTPVISPTVNTVTHEQKTVYQLAEQKHMPPPQVKDALRVSEPSVSVRSFADWLTLLWVTGLLLMLMRLGMSAWRLHRLGEKTKPISTDLLKSLPLDIDALAIQSGLHSRPHLLLGPADCVPMVWGVMKYRLLLPEGFHTWSADKLRAVLLHEFAHLRRRDPLALMAAQLTQALHWFNPLAWLALHQLRIEQEHACDDATLTQGMRPSDYAQHLLDLSRHTRLAPGLGMCALAMARPTPVENRVLAILDPHRSRQTASKWSGRFCLALALTLTLPLAMLHALETTSVRGRILDRYGVELAVSSSVTERRYPLQEAAAHVLGHTRKTPANQTATGVSELHGEAGIEKNFDMPLSAGKNVTLTLDQRIQQLTYNALKDAGVTRGSVVIMDPRNGDVLAMVSLPSYDPHAFLPRLAQTSWDSLQTTPDTPLRDHNTCAFVPGAAYTVTTALAGGLAGIEDKQFRCDSTLTYGARTLRCWRTEPHGTQNLSEALHHSCNCFFYQYGNEAGIDNLTKMGELLGFGDKTGIELPLEQRGILPSPEWLKKKTPNERWSDSYTANTSIGQGSVMVSPLQIAVLTSAIANGGQVPKPRLLHDNGPTLWRTDLTKEGVSPQLIETIRLAMREYVNATYGVGKKARSENYVIAGKAGTSQNWRLVNKQRVEDIHGSFMGFAPYDKPTLAFVVYVQGVKSGASTCAPIAKRIVEETLALGTR